MRSSTVPAVICIFAIAVSNGIDVHFESTENGADDVHSTNLTTYGNTLLELLENIRSPTTGEALLKDLRIYDDASGTKIVKCESERCLGCLQTLTMGVNFRMHNLWFVRDVTELRDNLKLNLVDYRPFCDWHDRETTHGCFAPYESNLGKRSILDHLMADDKKIPCGDSPKIPLWENTTSTLEGDFIKTKCYRRGSALRTDGNLLRFCDECHGIRVFSNEFSPSLFSEIQCDNSGSEVYLGGHGTCIQNYAHVKLTKKVKSQNKWENVDRVVGAGCIFVMKKNAVLHGLIGKS